MDQALLTTLAAAAGFISKSLWDLYWKRRGDLEAAARQKRIDFLERQLSLFYWPLYIHLQKNNVVWDHLLSRKPAEIETMQVVTHQLYHCFLLPNHENTLKLIEANIHLAQPDEELEGLILCFIRHVTIFRALRDGGLKNVDPIAVGEPWPRELFPAVERRLRLLQQQFDREIGRQAISEHRFITPDLVREVAPNSDPREMAGIAGSSMPIEHANESAPNPRPQPDGYRASHGPAD